jgi:hypothetical protein
VTNFLAAFLNIANLGVAEQSAICRLAASFRIEESVREDHIWRSILLAN